MDLGASGINRSNTSNLIINHGWKALLVDADNEAIDSAKRFYSTCPDTTVFPPTLVSAWITAKNINAILKENDYTGEIDLLSIDIDGIDYWIWKSITVVNPRVVLVEYQTILGPERSVTVPNKPEFKAGFSADGRFGIYNGASLPAFVKLGKQLGYRLIGCHHYGFNAFFLRNDIGKDIFSEISIEECFKHPFTEWDRNKFESEVNLKKWTEV